MLTAFRTTLVTLLMLALAIPASFAAPPPDARPYVLVVYADWCPSCQQLKPALARLNEEYRDKIRFVRFDITTEETAAKSKAKAEKLGLSGYYEKNHERTSVVIILDSSRHEVFRTVNDYAVEHYETVLNQQLSASHQ
jgi:thiol-disulfide isomerase/thioredoxin